MTRNSSEKRRVNVTLLRLALKMVWEITVGLIMV
jgi:hypothetical protein